MSLLPPDADYDQWRMAARPYLARRVPPERVRWSAGTMGDFFASDAPPEGMPTTVSVPRAFHEIAVDAALHSDPDRFGLLYRLAWRLQFEPRLMGDATDKDVAQLGDLAKSVRREVHKMHAYVRFREVVTDGGSHFIAWHEPKHYILARAAEFFARRFAAMRWTILTPLGSVAWHMKELVFGPPAERGDAPAFDAKEDEWRAYYENIFNPARLNMAAMLRHMPKRYWATMPETASIPALVRGAETRTAEMIAAAPTQMQRRLGGIEMAATRTAEADDVDAHGGTPPDSLSEMRVKLPACRACPLYRNATQAVPGEGPARAEIMLVGEQPGDQEDLQGKPFVGPAGKVLDRALEDAGIDRARVYVTNAVKHFKYEQRGKRRLHKPPNAGEVTACKWWLASERRIVKPKVTVALGATALSALAGPKATLKAYRGKVSETDGERLIATYHPSYILRIPDEAGKESAMAALTADLKRALKEAS